MIFIGMVCVALIVTLAMNDLINVMLVRSSKSSNVYKMERLVYGENLDSEVAIIGNSRAQNHFLPSEISSNAFNYGVAGAGWRDVLFHLKCLLKRKDSTIVICNLDPNGLTWGSVRGDYRFVSGSDAYKTELGMKHFSLKDRIPGLRFFGALRGNIEESEIMNIGGGKFFDNGAIVLKGAKRSLDEWSRLARRLSTIDFVCDPAVKGRLFELLETNKNHHEVVFVVSPLSSFWTEKYLGNEAFTRFFKELDKLPHVNVLDYRNAGFSLEDFNDILHLNIEGASKFSKLVRDDIRCMGLKL